MLVDLIERRPITGPNEAKEGGEFHVTPLALLTSQKAPAPSGPSNIPSPPLGLQPVGGGEASRPIGSEALDEVTRPQLIAEDETASPYRNKRWEVKELNSRHREMMRRILEGATYDDIAADMGLSYQTVMLVCSSAIFKEELKTMEAELNLNVIRRAEELSNEALDKLKRLMRQARSESLQATCARDVLGIAGYSKIEKKQVAVISGDDVIRELNRRRRELSDEQSRGNARPTPTASRQPIEAEVVS